jgi:hypothetical protein
MEAPHCWTPDSKVFTYWRLVEKHTVLDPVRLARIIEHKALVVLCTDLQNLFEHLKAWEDAEKVFVEALPILHDGLSKHKYIVALPSEVRRQVHTVLHSQHEEELPVSTVVKRLTDA